MCHANTRHVLATVPLGTMVVAAMLIAAMLIGPLWDFPCNEGWIDNFNRVAGNAECRIVNKDNRNFSSVPQAGSPPLLSWVRRRRCLSTFAEPALESERA